MLDIVTPVLEISVPAISDDTIRSLVADIEKTGYGCIPNYIPPEDLGAMRAFVSDAVQASGGEYVGFTGKDSVAGSAFDALSTCPRFQDLMKRIYEVGTGKAPPEVEFYQVLRCLSGQTAKKHSLRFHYDSYVVTALIPVEIPTTGTKMGDLIMLPNTRRIRSTYLANLIDKIILDNKMTQSLLRMLTSLRLLPLTRIRPVPGNIYFFWGYRSIHTNEACDPDKVRATALFHYANPHAGDRLNARRHRPAMA